VSIVEVEKNPFFVSLDKVKEVIEFEFEEIESLFELYKMVLRFFTLRETPVALMKVPEVLSDARLLLSDTLGVFPGASAKLLLI